MSEQEFNSFLATVDISCNGHEIKSRWFFSVDQGWLEIIEEMIIELFKAGWDGKLDQCKEKFGGLRFYIGGGSKKIYEIIGKYEKLSMTICEVCGLPGELKSKQNWFKTTCKDHE